MNAPRFILRDPQPGDLGWVVSRQAALYAREYGWDWTYEGLAAEIVSGFVKDFDPRCEQAWIAERDGERIGAVFLMRGGEAQVGKLRLLHVEAQARGMGVGTALVAACVARARQAGYQSLELWTNDVLAGARRLYLAAGFVLAQEDAHRQFGQALVGQTWRLRL